ncbi:unnamed protein product [Lactuca saligna]|uniref:NADP-dependent oxidoreductase domain-containing protein n=1 Tax=Lactuca saligna TaxID=75948 RepID=A0AA36DX80_LACSI|nr:unnamed protein product [Lactuca saligna]
MHAMAMALEIGVILRNPNACCSRSLFYMSHHYAILGLARPRTLPYTDDKIKYSAKLKYVKEVAENTGVTLASIQVAYGMMKDIGWCRMELHQYIPRKDGMEEITIIDPTIVQLVKSIKS